tara:strand:- start:721 stop:903 length:183 start_codon:yes stop_codon:yes gene_type:complete
MADQVISDLSSTGVKQGLCGMVIQGYLGYAAVGITDLNDQLDIPFMGRREPHRNDLRFAH